MSTFVEQQRKRLEALRKQLLGPEERRLAQERAFQQEHGDEAEEFEEKAQSMAKTRFIRRCMTSMRGDSVISIGRFRRLRRVPTVSRI